MDLHSYYADRSLNHLSTRASRHSPFQYLHQPPLPNIKELDITHRKITLSDIFRWVKHAAYPAINGCREWICQSGALFVHAQRLALHPSWSFGNRLQYTAEPSGSRRPLHKNLPRLISLRKSQARSWISFAACRLKTAPTCAELPESGNRFKRCRRHLTNTH